MSWKRANPLLLEATASHKRLAASPSHVYRSSAPSGLQFSLYIKIKFPTDRSLSCARLVAHRVECLQHPWTSGQMQSHEKKTGNRGRSSERQSWKQGYFFLSNLSLETFKKFITTSSRKINLGTSRYVIHFYLLSKYQVFLNVIF